jgi:Skp family chaperone for outer membrane proteins
MAARAGQAARLGACLALIAALMPDLPAAQEAASGQMPVLTLDPDRLFSGSLFGRQTLAEVEAEALDLQAENRRIEADLEVEEQRLTDERAGMAPGDFRAAADAFDDKVQGIRAAQTAKARDLALRRDAARQRFLQAAAPVLAAIMTERGAVAIIDRSAIILSFDRADITDLAIARVDQVLAGEPAPDPGAAPEAVPAPDADALPATGPASVADPAPRPDPATDGLPDGAADGADPADPPGP